MVIVQALRRSVSGVATAPFAGLQPHFDWDWQAGVRMGRDNFSRLPFAGAVASL